MSDAGDAMVPRGRRALAGLPALLGAATFAWPALGHGYLPGTNLAMLSRAMQVEALVLLGGLVYIFPLVPFSRGRGVTRLRVALFFLLAAPFAWGAWHVDGARGAVAFVALLFVVYGGTTVFTRIDRYSEIVGLVAATRLAFCMVAFFALAPNLGLDLDVRTWADREETVQLGAAFLFAVFLLELTLFASLTAEIERQAIARDAAAKAPPVDPLTAEADAARAERIARRRRYYDVITGRDSRAD